MKKILVLGAGQSTPYLIHRLLEKSTEYDWKVTVGDYSLEMAQLRVNGHKNGTATKVNVLDATQRAALIKDADLVVSLLSPEFLDLTATECLAQGRHMLCASYRSPKVISLDKAAREKGLLFLCELGLDPGLDLMSAMEMIERIHSDGGRITGFCSYGSGVPSIENPRQNPLRYVITWNPRNVVMAAEKGAQYLKDGQIRLIPYRDVFHHTWPVEVRGVGTMEAYTNRDSLAYPSPLGLKDIKTMIRGTLRFPGYCEIWSAIVALGLPNEHLYVPGLPSRSYREVLEMFLPGTSSDGSLEERVARKLGISPTGHLMETLQWLGIFSDETIACEGETPAAMLIHLLRKKLVLERDAADMVILLHEMDVDYPGTSRPPERITAQFVAKGTPGGFTAMAFTVGFPVAFAAELFLTGRLKLEGVQLPTLKEVYTPTLQALQEEGMAFEEWREVRA